MMMLMIVTREGNILVDLLDEVLTLQYVQRSFIEFYLLSKFVKIFVHLVNRNEISFMD